MEGQKINTVFEKPAHVKPALIIRNVCNLQKKIVLISLTSFLPKSLSVFPHMFVQLIK